MIGGAQTLCKATDVSLSTYSPLPSLLPLQLPKSASPMRFCPQDFRVLQYLNGHLRRLLYCCCRFCDSSGQNAGCLANNLNCLRGLNRLVLGRVFVSYPSARACTLRTRAACSHRR